jgi:hypothetical protein
MPWYLEFMCWARHVLHENCINDFLYSKHKWKRINEELSIITVCFDSFLL